MALKKHVVNVPISAGQQSTADPVVVQPPAVLAAQNVHFNKNGVLTKRNGDVAVGAASVSSGIGPYSLHEGAQLEILTKNGLYGYDAASNRWKSHNLLGMHPAEISVQTLNDGIGSQKDYDYAVYAGFECITWASSRYTDDTGVTTTGPVYYMVREATTGAVVLPPTKMETTSYGQEIKGSPRVVPIASGTNKGFLIVAHASRGATYTSASDLYGVGILIVAGSTPVASVATLLLSTDTCQFDITASSTTAFICATEPAAASITNLHFLAVTLSGAAVPTIGATKDVQDLASEVEAIGFFYHPVNARLYLALGLSDSTLNTYRIDTGLGTLTVGTTLTTHSFPGGTALHFCHIAYAVSGSGGTQSTIFWDTHPVGVSTGHFPSGELHWAVEYAVVDIDSALPGTANTPEILYNYQVYSKGFNDSRTTTYVPYVCVVHCGGNRVSYPPGDTNIRILQHLEPTVLVVHTTTRESRGDQGGLVTLDTLRVVARIHHNRGRADIIPPNDVGRAHLPTVCKPNSDLDKLRMACDWVSRMSDTSDAHINGVQQVSWAGSVVDIDLNPAAPRTVKILNGLLMFSGGYSGGFDEVDSFESPFHHGPQAVVTNTDFADVYAGTASPVTYVAVYEWEDALGNLHRSAPSSPQVALIDAGGATERPCFPYPPPNAAAQQHGRGIEVVLYQSSTDGMLELARGIPTQLTGDWAGYAYLPATLGADANPGPEVYTEPGELPADSCPALKDITSDGRRLYGVSSEHPSEVRMTKLLTPGYAPEWNDNLVMRLPAAGGKLVAVEALDEKVLAFKETEIYYLFGDGPDNNGQGSFSVPARIPGGVGCLTRSSVCSFPGGIFFQSRRGFAVVGRDLAVKYVGYPVETSLNASGLGATPYTVLAAAHIPAKSEIRVMLSSGVSLVWNYLFDQWSTWTPHEGQHYARWGNLGARVMGTGVVYQETVSAWTSPDKDFAVSITTPWLSLPDSGQSRFRRGRIVGDHYATCGLSWAVRINGVDTTVATKTWTAAQIAALSRFELEVHTPAGYQKANSIQYIFTETGTLSSAGFTIANLQLELGLLPGRLHLLRDGAKK